MSHRILVVEDNPANQELLCDWLEMEGFEVVSATNLEGAFAAVKSEKPDAVLLDVQLGAEDGLALAAWIRQDTRLRSVPVIAVTAHAMVTDHARVLQAGCDACVSKPIDFRALGAELGRWLHVAAKSESRL
jgi:CheY-like chemotaxis protein